MHDTNVYASKFIKPKEVYPLQKLSNVISLTKPVYKITTFNCKVKGACALQSIVVFYTVPNFMPPPFKI